jgi:hypothetical protein
LGESAQHVRGPTFEEGLDRLIGRLGYRSLEHRLTAMRLSGQLEAVPGNGRAPPYAVTDWLRHAVGPLVAATRWERCSLPEETARIGRIDAEAAFLPAVPLVRLPAATSGACRLAVELPGGGGRLAGVTVGVEDSRVVCPA